MRTWPLLVALLPAAGCDKVGRTAPDPAYDAAQLFGPVAEMTLDGTPLRVRRVKNDRIRVPNGPLALGDGSFGPPPQWYETEDRIRVAGTDDPTLAIRAVHTFCGQAAPEGQALLDWGGEAVTRAEDTGEWQIWPIC